MRGFDNKALILFPRLEIYESKSQVYKLQFRSAICNLMHYLEDCHIEPHCFYTDDLARELPLFNVRWLSPITMAERFFASRNCKGMQNAMRDMVEFPEFYKIAEEKCPTNLDAELEYRFDVIEKHVKVVTTKVIETYNIVFDFRVGTKGQYTVKTKEDDGKIRVFVDTNTFMPTYYMSGYKEDGCDILRVPYGNRSLDNWG